MELGGALSIVKNIALGVLPTALGLAAFGVARDRKQSAVMAALWGAGGALVGATAQTYLADPVEGSAPVAGLAIERVGFNTPYAWRTHRAYPRTRISGLTLERVGMCGPYGCA